MVETDIKCRRRVVLLDLDNCPSIQGNDDVEAVLGTAERIVAFHAPGEPQVPLSIVRSLAAGLAADRVEIEQVPCPGDLPADLGLLFWAGRLLGETPPDVEIVVVSRSGALDHAMALLEKADRTAIAVNDRKEPQGPADVVVRTTALAEHLQGLPSRPKNAKALRNYIRSYLRDERRSASAIVAELVDGGHVAVDQRGNVTYPAVASGGNGTVSGCSEHNEDCIPF